MDENFDHHILRALVRRVPDLDFRTIQGQAMLGAEDPQVLAWAAAEDRVLLTHDVRTVTSKLPVETSGVPSHLGRHAAAV